MKVWRRRTLRGAGCRLAAHGSFVLTRGEAPLSATGLRREAARYAEGWLAFAEKTFKKINDPGRPHGNRIEGV